MFEKPFEQKSAENCSEDMNRGSVTLTDTDDNSDVWNSKAVYDTGIMLEKGKTYTATVKLSGGNVGEFFFLKSDNIDDRYSFNNTSGEHTITFTAEDTALLYFGVQCGNIGKGNSVTASNITVKEADSTQPATLCMALTPVAEKGLPLNRVPLLSRSLPLNRVPLLNRKLSQSRIPLPNRNLLLGRNPRILPLCPTLKNKELSPQLIPASPCYAARGGILCP